MKHGHHLAEATLTKSNMFDKIQQFPSQFLQNVNGKTFEVFSMRNYKENPQNHSTNRSLKFLFQ